MDIIFEFSTDHIIDKVYIKRDTLMQDVFTSVCEKCRLEMKYTLFFNSGDRRILPTDLGEFLISNNSRFIRVDYFGKIPENTNHAQVLLDMNREFDVIVPLLIRDAMENNDATLLIALTIYSHLWVKENYCGKMDLFRILLEILDMQERRKESVMWNKLTDIGKKIKDPAVTTVDSIARRIKEPLPYSNE